MTDAVDTLLPAVLVERAAEVIAANRAAGRCVAVAESCTGGLVSAALTEVPGSSDVFLAGFVTYADDAKRSALGVAGDVLETFGAVSIAAAWAMAQGVLDRTGADIVVSVTGIAGPGGGSARKPVGTVMFARAERGLPPEAVKAERRDLGDLGRGGVRLQAALVALELLMPGAETAVSRP